MPTVDKENLKELFKVRVKNKKVIRGYSLEKTNYEDFNTKNRNAPELLPLIEIVKAEFPELDSKINCKNMNLKVIKKFKSSCGYYLTFKLLGESDSYTICVSEDFSNVSIFAKSNRKATLNDYIHLLNHVFNDTSNIEKLTI